MKAEIDWIYIFDGYLNYTPRLYDDHHLFECLTNDGYIPLLFYKYVSFIDQFFAIYRRKGNGMNPSNGFVAFF